MNPKIVKLNDYDGLVIEYEDNIDFTRSLLRFSEFNCKEKFRRIFLIEDYAKEQGYALKDKYDVAEAIMVMDNYIIEMYKHYTDYNLYIEEKKLVKYLINNGYVDSEVATVLKPFFIIGLNIPIIKDVAGAIRHELSHVLYMTDSKYRNLVENVFNGMNDVKQDAIKTYLTKFGYTSGEILDEFQAHYFYGFGEYGKTILHESAEPLGKYYREAVAI